MEFVSIDVTDGVAVLRLDRPKMNAISVQVQADLREAAAELTERDDVRSVVVWGGERVFAAGNDVKEMADLSYAEMVKVAASATSAITAIARIPKPVVAAVNGYALGGGCELALAADFRFAAEDAVLGQPEVLLGIIPGAGGTQRLTRLVGPAKAKDIIFTGRFVKADEALPDRAGRPGDPRRQGARGGGGLRLAVQWRGGPRDPRGQGVHRPGQRDRPRHRPGDRAPAVRRDLRDGGPYPRDDLVR